MQDCLLSVLVPVLLFCPLTAGAQPSSPAPDRQETRSLPAERLQSITELRSERRFRKALDKLTRLTERHPNNVELLWRQALIWTDLGKTAESPNKAIRAYRQAIEHAEAAVEVDSTNAWAHLINALAEGRLCLHLDRTERARHSQDVKAHVDRALALDSTLAPAYHVRGRWYRRIADLNFLERSIMEAVYGDLPAATFEQSVHDLKRALSMESKSYHHLHLAKTYLAMDKEAAAREHLRAALTASGSPLAPEYKQEAGLLLQELN